MKTCTKCGTAKPITEFGKNAGGRNGLRSHCKACVNIASAAWYTANTERVKASGAAWHAANKDRVKANKAALHAANPGRAKATAAEWRKANPDKARASTAAWYAANAEKARATAKAWRDANPDKIRAKGAAWRKANPERCKALGAAWEKANPESRRIIYLNRRARKLAVGGKLSVGLADKLFKQQKGKCPCCRKPLGDNYHRDHKTPLALGGANEDWNIQLLCAPCNLSKGKKHPIDFMQSKGFLI
jgi:hypothetical protein